MTAEAVKNKGKAGSTVEFGNPFELGYLVVMSGNLTVELTGFLNR